MRESFRRIVLNIHRACSIRQNIYIYTTVLCAIKIKHLEFLTFALLKLRVSIIFPSISIFYYEKEKQSDKKIYFRNQGSPNRHINRKPFNPPLNSTILHDSSTPTIRCAGISNNFQINKRLNRYQESMERVRLPNDRNNDGFNPQ